MTKVAFLVVFFKFTLFYGYLGIHNTQLNSAGSKGNSKKHLVQELVDIRMLKKMKLVNMKKVVNHVQKKKVKMLESDGCKTSLLDLMYSQILQVVTSQLYLWILLSTLISKYNKSIFWPRNIWQ